LSHPELIKKLKKKNPNLNQSELKIIIDVFIKSVFSALVEKKTVEIRGFGRWYCKKLKENFNARNPSNNQLVYKPERVKVRFRPSKKLKNLLINE
jgi:nucleoid DNA-binding protein|tara:strand:+ start:1666 stop:1950 length:285 start_codon:yes stop_codon:yes gene_type:complete